jgi:valyl-tRNA synthetase
MPHELPKAYEPGAIEMRWAEYWKNEHLFDAPTPPEGRHARTFSLLLPPPNVTGRLHMGHMLNQTQMDIIIRWHRMLGDLTLWLPGTDHAGIATQMMVERQLRTEGKSRQELGREEFVLRVWCWKKQYGGAILEQMERLGASVDWHRLYFTMDDDLSHAVREVFVRLYEQGLIYRGNYIVNWCPDCGTAVSDLEVKHEDVPGKLYEIRYPVVGSKEFITVATTRPETMLGDTAIAVNANDIRYKHLHGKHVILPLMNREIPIITDELANPEFGTGAVKVTPAHDPNDFKAGLRHNLPQITVMDERAHMNENAGPYAGLERFKARERVIADLEAQGFLAAVKDYTIPLGRCDRSGTIIEPRLSEQWFIKIEPLAKRAIEVVEKGYIRFTPDNYKQIYLNWMYNIHDWCISRQLWWGHRIPVWRCADCKEVIVAREAPTKCTKCAGANLEQDTDVLDTWFSSGLLPFTALGWPEATRDLETFYPTSLLITGFDILFFWVARMIMFGCWFMMPPEKPEREKQSDPIAPDEKVKAILMDRLGASQAKEVMKTAVDEGLDTAELAMATEQSFDIKIPIEAGDLKKVRIPQSHHREEALRNSVPFREVYIHALVRDAERQKMSKTKGNVLDPIEVINQYGTDATRFTLAAMAAPGTDIAFNPSRTEGYRNFANKIWNAARFLFMNLDRLGDDVAANVARTLLSAKSEQLSENKSSVPQVRGRSSDANLGLSHPKGIPAFAPATLEDRWILSRFNRATADVNDALLTYRFHEAANRIYDFFWGELCDWYLELIKPRLMGDDAAIARQACTNLLTLFEASLRLLHPVMPFITEEIWHAIYDGKPPLRSIALAAYPQSDDKQIDLASETHMAVLQDLIVSIRNLRAELKVENKLKVPIQLYAHEPEIRTVIEQNQGAVERQANVERIEFVNTSLAKLPGARHTARFDVHVLYEQKIDVAAECERLRKELEKIEKALVNGGERLGNETFLSKAPANVVEGLRKQVQENEILLEKTKSKMQELGCE